MIAALLGAVGPVQASEHVHVGEVLRCSAASGQKKPKPCAFQIFDGGPGRIYLRCTPHEYVSMARDADAKGEG